VTFGNGTNSDLLGLSAVAAGTDSDTGEILGGGTLDVDVDVVKTSNGGLAEADVTIEWIVNGVPFGSPETIASGDPVNTSRLLTGLVGNETLRVEITEQDTGFAPYTVYTELTESVTGSPTWRAHFIGKILSVTGNGATAGPGNAASPSGSFSVAAYAEKTTNGGIAQDAGTVVFKKNGATMDTQNFSNSDDVSNIGYTFTGVAPGDDLEIIITEG
jgi:hypothetical protein